MKMKCDCSYTILTWDFQSENDVDISAAIHKNLFLLFKWFQMKWPLKRSIRRIDSTAGGSSDTEIERKKKYKCKRKFRTYSEKNGMQKDVKK